MGWPTWPVLFEKGTVGLDLSALSPLGQRDLHQAVGGAEAVPSAAMQEATT